MARNDGRNDEIEALLSVEGVNAAKITKQVNDRKGIKEVVPPTPTPTGNPVTPPVTPTVPPVENKNVPDPETIRTAMLNEMFGEQFKTVEDVKKANIPASLQELVTLRQTKQDLETQLKTKPKHRYANDNTAKFDEFVRSTGIEDAVIFNRINATDVANMDNMDALVMQHVIENPSLAGKEPQVRRYFEKKYDVDSSKVEAGDLTQDELDTNLIGVASDGAKAKAKLKELKGKIKMPDIPADEPPEGKPKWTPEVEKSQKAIWATANEAMVKEFSTIPIPIKGSKDPIINFALPEETRKVIMSSAIDYAVSNQLEINEANLRSAARLMYSRAIESNLDEIAHAIFERARSMSEDEYLKLYSNPSPKNADTPPIKGEVLTDEAKREKVFQAEMKRR